MTVPIASVTLAALKPIGPKYVNPHAAEAERIAKQLCFDLGIGLIHFDEYNTMPAYLFPETGLYRLVTMNLFFNLLYYIDDVYDRHVAGSREDNSQLADTFLLAAKILMRGNRHFVTDEPILRAAYEMHLQFSAQASEDWLDRFTASLMTHLSSSLMNMDSTDVPAPIDGSRVDQYNTIRDHDAGMQSTLDLIEFATGIIVNPELLEHPVIESARQQVTRYCSLSNDLFSYEKEVLRHGSDFSIVTVLMEEGRTFTQAVDEVIHQLNEMVETFVHMEAQLPLFDDDKTNMIIAEYFRGLRHQLSAAYHWQYDTPRYRSPNSPFIELREWVEQPDSVWVTT